MFPPPLNRGGGFLWSLIRQTFGDFPVHVRHDLYATSMFFFNVLNPAHRLDLAGEI
jgi:hypothetical protein